MKEICWTFKNAIYKYLMINRCIIILLTSYKMSHKLVLKKHNDIHVYVPYLIVLSVHTGVRQKKIMEFSQLMHNNLQWVTGIFCLAGTISAASTSAFVSLEMCRNTWCIVLSVTQMWKYLIPWAVTFFTRKAALLQYLKTPSKCCHCHSQTPVL